MSAHRNKLLLSLVTLTFINFGCTKKDSDEKVLVPARQAPTEITQSINLQKSKNNSITLNKESLGKAFILIPVTRTSNNTPAEGYLSPLIISFEKAGNRIALFNLTEPQLYDTIKSDRLLQTFAVISEDDTSLVIDLGNGFTSLNATQNEGVLTKSNIERINQRIQSGNETSIEVKESFIRSASVSNNSIIIEQIMRLRSQEIKEIFASNNANGTRNTSSSISLESSENTVTVSFEIKPYIQHTSFVSKTFDKNFNYGYFINFAVQSQTEEAIPQIAKWDMDPARGPITVRLSENTPEIVKQSIQEGVLYWNKVFRGEVIKIGSPFNSKESQLDRTIHIFWIPWKTAGYAQAGIQADPITGEIFRGQVFMTSSWYYMTKDRIDIMPGVSQAPSNSIYHKCVLDQNKLLSSVALQSTDKSQVEKASLDTIRIVLAHEIGHTLGLRHNFAGSSTTGIDDDELASYRAQYKQGKGKDNQVTSTTVMDYFDGLDTAINGNFIKNNVMKYDQEVINWGYFNSESKDNQSAYCSDEHIMMADMSDKKIYGCQRFDKNKNQIKGLLENFKNSLDTQALKNLRTIVQTMRRNNSYYADTTTLEKALLNMSFENFDAYDLKNYIYEDQFSNSYVSLKGVMKNALNLLSRFDISSEIEISSFIEKESKEAGGYAGIIKSILDQRNQDSNYFQKQVLELFEKMNPNDYSNFSAKELALIKSKMLEKAKEGDDHFTANILLSFPGVASVYKFMRSENTYKSFDRQISQQFDFGDANTLISTFVSAYQNSLGQQTKLVSVNGQIVTFYERQSDTFSIGEKTRSLFSISKFSEFYSANKSIIDAGIEQFKAISARNSLQILNLMGIETPKPLTYENLQRALIQVDWSKVKGVDRNYFFSDLSEFKNWEDMPYGIKYLNNLNQY